MQGLINDLDRVELMTLLNEIGLAEPRPPRTPDEVELMRKLWFRLQPIQVTELEAVRRIHGRIKTAPRGQPPVNSGKQEAGS